MEPQPAQSARIAPRIPFHRPVHIRVLPGPAPLRRLFSSNVSTGGMFIRTPKPLEPGTQVEVFLEVKGRALRLGDAAVAFELPLIQANQVGRLPGFGIRFVRLSERAQQLLGALSQPAKNGSEDDFDVTIDVEEAVDLGLPLDRARRARMAVVAALAAVSAVALCWVFGLT